MLIDSTLTLCRRTFVAEVRRSPPVPAMVAQAGQLHNRALLCNYIRCRSRLVGVQENSVITSSTCSQVADVLRRAFLHLHRA